MYAYECTHQLLHKTETAAFLNYNTWLCVPQRNTGLLFFFKEKAMIIERFIRLNHAGLSTIAPLPIGLFNSLIKCFNQSQSRPVY